MNNTNMEQKLFIAMLFGQMFVFAVVRLISPNDEFVSDTSMMWMIGTAALVGGFIISNGLKRKNVNALSSSTEADKSVLYQSSRTNYMARLGLMEGAVILNIVLCYLDQNNYLIYNALVGVFLFVMMRQTPEEKEVFDTKL